MRPDGVIYWTLGNFSKPLARINLSKSPTFLGNLGKGVKNFHFSSEIIFWATFKDIWRLFTGHSGHKKRWGRTDHRSLSSEAVRGVVEAD